MRNLCDYSLREVGFWSIKGGRFDSWGVFNGPNFIFQPYFCAGGWHLGERPRYFLHTLKQ